MRAGAAFAANTRRMIAGLFRPSASGREGESCEIIHRDISGRCDLRQGEPRRSRGSPVIPSIDGTRPALSVWGCLRAWSQAYPQAVLGLLLLLSKLEQAMVCWDRSNRVGFLTIWRGDRGGEQGPACRRRSFSWGGPGRPRCGGESSERSLPY